MGVPVARPGRFVAPSGDPGVAEVSGRSFVRVKGPCPCLLWGRAGLSGGSASGFASPFQRSDWRLRLKGDFLKQMEANLVLLHSGLHQPLLENLPRVSEAKGFASVVPLLLSFSLTQ